MSHNDGVVFNVDDTQRVHRQCVACKYKMTLDVGCSLHLKAPCMCDFQDKHVQCFDKCFKSYKTTGFSDSGGD